MNFAHKQNSDVAVERIHFIVNDLSNRYIDTINFLKIRLANPPRANLQTTPLPSIVIVNRNRQLLKNERQVKCGSRETWATLSGRINYPCSSIRA